MAGIITYKPKNYVIFSNPDSKNTKKGGRRNLTIKLSKDDCNTWEALKVLEKLL